MGNNIAHISGSPSGVRAAEPLHVLIVEDSPVTQDVLKEMLRAAGHKVHLAGEGRSALKAMNAENFDVVLIDYHMPHMHGSEVVREFVGQKGEGSSPIFAAITADPAAILNDREQIRFFHTVFAKPFEFEEVLSFVESVRAGKSSDAAIAARSGAESAAVLPLSSEEKEAEPEIAVDATPEAESLLDQDELARRLNALMPGSAFFENSEQPDDEAASTSSDDPLEIIRQLRPGAQKALEDMLASLVPGSENLSQIKDEQREEKGTAHQVTQVEEPTEADQPPAIETQKDLTDRLGALMPVAREGSFPAEQANAVPAGDEGTDAPEEDAEAEVGPPDYSRAVLIAEDSPVTQDILKLLLSSSGYEVDVAQDGTEALKMIKAKNYFVALMDYNMPGLNGTEVIKHCLEEISGRALPIFAAMTAEPSAVLADKYGEKFSKIFAKPFNFDEVRAYIEEVAESVLGGVANDGAAITAGVPAPAAAPTVNLKEYSAEVARGLESYGVSARVLRWPEDIGPAGFSVAARQYMAAGSDFDAVLISERATVHDLRHLWTLGDLHLLPIIDETGQLGPKADVSIPSLPRGVVGRLLEGTMQEFREARQSVHIEVRQSKETSEKLAASIYVRKRVLTPEYSAENALGFTYDCAQGDEEILSAVTNLTEQKLLQRKFFDRFHVCNGCQSTHLNVREECFECRSPNLSETTLVHHFRCAYQGPLQDFQQGADLVCPKCSRELRHFGVDYDKPGIVINCGACGASSSDAAVGFKCLSCGQHTDGEMIRTRDVFQYELTEKGVAFIEEGPIVIGGGQKQLKFAELPLELVIELNKSAREFTETSRPFCLMSIGYPDRRALTSEHGFRLVEVSRSQMVENLRNYFGDQAITHQGTDYDYILVNRLAVENCRANIETYNEAALSGLKIDLNPRIASFGPEELFG